MLSKKLMNAQKKAASAAPAFPATSAAATKPRAAMETMELFGVITVLSFLLLLPVSLLLEGWGMAPAALTAMVGAPRGVGVGGAGAHAHEEGRRGACRAVAKPACLPGCVFWRVVSCMHAVVA